METINFFTPDGLTIFGGLHSIQSKRVQDACMILAPGFAQHSQTHTMSQICSNLAKTLDVLCVDFRGTGGSEGGFYFGEREYLDLAPVISWAHSQYSKVFVLGLSLGAYSSLRAVVEFGPNVKHLFLVSCPTRVDDIFWSGAAFRHSIDQVLRRGGLRKDRDLIFRWRNPFLKKPNATEFASRLSIPVSFLVGGRDLLTPKAMSHSVFQAVSKTQKSWLELPHGNHAEELFFSGAQEVDSWIATQITSSSL